MGSRNRDWELASYFLHWSTYRRENGVKGRGRLTTVDEEAGDVSVCCRQHRRVYRSFRALVLTEELNNDDRR
jgi:hypothetical protein